MRSFSEWDILELTVILYIVFAQRELKKYCSFSYKMKEISLFQLVGRYYVFKYA